ncbi:Putative ribosomal protein S2 [Septoria linicola]|uniref:Ribosomal protein S2 n=1 Tax=Septoria linicola TaxID=215465 RepID=A0A9Q9B1W0_9PEZI|nr:putative ribosomal protein S2 [Septoria linicola]USW59454.1 Putative ribosomal protein S2 [Septoria linicola]
MIIRALRLRHGRIALPRSIHTSTTRLSSLESTVSPNAEPGERVGLPQFTATAKETIGPNTIVDRTVPLNDPNHPVALDYAFAQHNKKFTSRVGSTIAPHYKPHELLTKPPSPRDITLEALIAAQAHIGHATSLWNPSNARYIFGVRGDHDPIHIISPDATASHLRRACKVVQGVAERGGLILFVGTRQGQARAVVKAAELSKGCHLFTKWIPGSITNGQQILGRCEKRVYTENDEDVTEKYRFEDQLFAKAAIKPDLVVCLNPLENYVLLHECGLNNIPTVGIIDTDANPTWVTYPIPANDDSLRAVQFICGVLGRAGQDGQEQRLRDARPRAGRPDGFVAYPAIHGLQAPEEDHRRDRRGGNTRSVGNAQRMKVAARAAPQTAAAAEEPLFPDDFEGADVKQHEADQAMLEAAERTIFENEFPSAAAADGATAIPSAEQMSGMETAETDQDLDDDVYASFNDSPDLSSVDQSLVDETYLPAEEQQTSAAEDAAQFGIHMPPTTSGAGKDDPVYSQAPSSGAGNDTMDQVSQVEQELGEQAPEVEGVPGGQGNPDVKVKDVDRESQREVDAAVVDVARREEQGKRGRK